MQLSEIKTVEQAKALAQIVNDATAEETSETALQNVANLQAQKEKLEAFLVDNPPVEIELETEG